MKLFISVILVVLGNFIYAQAVRQPLGGSPNVNNFVRGILSSDSGIVVKSFPDTLTANKGPNIKKTHGLMIIVHDTIFIRDTIQKKWLFFLDSKKLFDSIVVYNGNTICQTKGGVQTCYPLNTGGGGGTVTGVDSVTFTFPNTICYHKNNVPTCFTLPSDSTKKINDTTVCFYSAGVPDCYIIHGNVLVESPDSLNINGNLFCFTLDGIETCITINSVVPGINKILLNSDSSYYYAYNGLVLIDSFPTLLSYGDTCFITRDSSNGKRYTYMNPNCRNAGGLGSSSRILRSGAITVSSDTVKIAHNIVWLCNNVEDSLTTDYSVKIPSTPDGYQRTDRIYVNCNTGSIDTLQGYTDTIRSVLRILPPGAIPLSDIDIYKDSIGAVFITPLYGSQGVLFADSLTKQATTDVPNGFVYSKRFASLWVPQNINIGLYGRLGFGLNNEAYIGRRLINDWVELHSPTGLYFTWMGGNTMSLGLTSGYNNVPTFNFGPVSESTPDAALSVSSANKGFLLPRLNTSFQNAISSPHAGLVIWNTDSLAICVFNGSQWRKLAIGVGTSGWSLTGNAGTNPGVNYVGTSDATSLYLGVGGSPVALFGIINNASISSTLSATGSYSFSVGNGPTASGNNSIAMVSAAFANNDYAVAIGRAARSIGQSSFAIGTEDTATGWYSTAMGINTNSVGTASTAMGFSTISKARTSTVIGEMNDNSDSPSPSTQDPSDRIFQIGNGNIGTSNRSNAMTVLRNGNVGIGTTTPAATLQIASTDSNVLKLSGLINTVLATDSSLVIGTDGNIKKAVKSSGSGNTIYTGDGTLAGNRILNGNGNGLAFDSTFSFEVRNKYLGVTQTYLNISPYAGHQIAFNKGGANNENLLIVNATGSSISSENGTGYASTITATTDSIIIHKYTPTGSNRFAIYEDSVSLKMRNTSTPFKIWNLGSGVGTKALRYNPSTGSLSYADTTGAAGVTSVSGTTNRITSTGGTTPVIDISSSYVGQSSITTLGTVATGTWNATTIDTAKTNAVSNINVNAPLLKTVQGKGYLIRADTGRANTQLATGWDLAKVRDSLPTYGTYTPTFTNKVNIDSIRAENWKWTRIGNEVNISGYIIMDGTASASTTTFTCTLPINPTSNFSNIWDLKGLGQAEDNAAARGLIFKANVGTSLAAGAFSVNSTAFRSYYFTTTYSIQ